MEQMGGAKKLAAALENVNKPLCASDRPAGKCVNKPDLDMAANPAAASHLGGRKERMECMTANGAIIGDITGAVRPDKIPAGIRIVGEGELSDALKPTKVKAIFSGWPDAEHQTESV